MEDKLMKNTSNDMRFSTQKKGLKLNLTQTRRIIHTEKKVFDKGTAPYIRIE